MTPTDIFDMSGYPGPASTNAVRAIPRPPASRSSRDLLTLAYRDLGEAERAERPADRYVRAHLAALRAAAAMLADRAKPSTGRNRPRSVWKLLPSVAPEFTEWAGFFEAGAAKRAAAEAGIIRVVSERDADDLLRDSGIFVGLIRERIEARHVFSATG